MQKHLKLTPLGRVLAFIVLLAVVLVPTYYLGGFNGISELFSKKPDNTKPADNSYVDASKLQKTSGDTIALSLDEWIGWKPIMDANGGLKTKAGSVFDKLGLKVEINIINDATQSSNALIKGSLNAAGYTVNRYAFLYPKFKEANVPVSMVYMTNTSTGGDGIIGKQQFNSIEDLANAKIGIPRFSEAQTLTYWLLQRSSLTPEQVEAVRKNMVEFDTPDDAAKAFFAGQIDAAATWQPYLSQAKDSNGKVIFSTKAARNLIQDGIIFRKDFVASHPELVEKFIEGSLTAYDKYTTEFTAIKDSMPLFSTETDDSIKGMTEDATLCDYGVNMDLFKGTAQTLFMDMSNIWKDIGEKADPAYAQEAFDGAPLQALAGKFETAANNQPKFTEQQRQTAKTQDNKEALMKQTFTITFKSDSDEFADQDAAYEALNKVVETAKILDNTIIQIEGNTNSDVQNDFNIQLSEKRAKAVSTYLRYQGLNPTRFVVIGNGSSKPVAPNDNEEHRVQNRRTDVFFKVVQ